MQRSPARRRHSSLQRVVQRSPPVYRSTRENPSPLQDAKRVAVYWERVAPEAVQKNAAGCFPGETGEMGEDTFGVAIAHRAQQVERQFARKSPHTRKQMLNPSRFLQLETSLSKYGCDVASRRALDRLPARIRPTQAGPGQAQACEVGLKTQDDIDRLVEWIILIAEIILRCSVGTFENLIDRSETLGSASSETCRCHLDEPQFPISSTSPSTRSINNGGTEFPTISYALRRQTTFEGNVIRSGMPWSRAYSRTERERFSA